MKHALSLAYLVLAMQFATAQEMVNKYAAVQKQYESAIHVWQDRFDGNSNEDGGVSRYRDWPGWKFAPQFIKLAESDAPKHERFESIVSVIKMGSEVGEYDRELYSYYERAIALMLAEHKDEPLGELCSQVGTSPQSEAFLNFLAHHADTVDIRAEAFLHLGRLYSMRREVGMMDAKNAVLADGRIGKYMLDRATWKDDSPLPESELNDLLAQSRQAFRSAIKNSSSLAAERNNESVVTLARRALFALEHLSLGCEAPEISGLDLHGNALRLSDSRGKVTLVVFWASWCGPCIADLPHEKSLLKKFEGLPFTIIGVNGDANLDDALLVSARKEIPFRSFRNATNGKAETITDAWDVNAWPTVYLLDSTGKIRYKQLRREQLDIPIEMLLKELE